jgi:DNA polymerase-1
MTAVDGWVRDTGAPAEMIMQVHDELVLEVEAPAAEEVGRAVTRIMTEAAELRVPLVVDLGLGANWDEAH